MRWRCGADPLVQGGLPRPCCGYRLCGQRTRDHLQAWHASELLPWQNGVGAGAALQRGGTDTQRFGSERHGPSKRSMRLS
eukprot:12894840-Prorocentrum_lima.AAC.1